MNKSNLILTIVLTALITVILIAGIVLIVVLSGDSEPVSTPADSTSVTVTTTKPYTTPTIPYTTPVFTTPNPTQNPDTTPNTPVTTTKPTTTPNTPVTTTKPTTTPNTPVTTPPIVVPPSPGLNAVSGTVEGDKLGSLGICASYVTEKVDKENRTMTIRVTFYAESYALRIGARTDNYLMVNGKKMSGLDSDAINLPNGSPQTRTVLYEYVTTVSKPDDTPVTLELEYFWHFQASYSGVSADWLSVKMNLTI